MSWIASGVSLFVCAGLVAPAQAIEVSCIEASRYEHIFRIFENDSNRFAAYFGAGSRQLPRPENCRAVLITGPVERMTRDGGENDFDRLLKVIRENGGWLTTLYLASPGGTIATGLRLGELTRMFWLNAYAIEQGTFEYVPDFLGANGPGSPADDIPENLERGWRDYVAATQTIARQTMTDRRARRCASACTFIHAAGVYRRGNSYFHRGRRSAPNDQEASQPQETSMSEIIEGLQKSENRIVSFYRKMDAGDAAVRAFQSTSSETTLSADIPVMPRYIWDYLKKQCTASQARQTGSPSSGAQGSTRSGPSAQRPFPVSSSDLQCIAASHSRERLKQFAKLCPNDCDRKEMLRETNVRIRALLPEDNQRRSSSQQRQQRTP